MSWTRLISSLLTTGLLAGSVLFPVRVSAGQVTATLRRNNDILQGTSLENRPLLYAPGIVQLGSSVSHFDISATPNLLMEPFISNDLPFLGLDLTPQVLQDIGWEAGTSNFTIIDGDEEGTGFTDPRPFPGAPGNPATTLGEARQNLFAGILGAWGLTLDSNVEIEVLVRWAALPCTPGSGAALAGAAPSSFFAAEVPGILPELDTLYPAALAESFVGENVTDLIDPDLPDIFILMNSLLDEGCLGEGTGFYYGLDADNPAGTILVSATILHELAHGLGFSNTTNEVTGSQGGPLPNIFDHFTFDETQRRNWVRMGNEERRRSATNDKFLTWSGPALFQVANTTLEPGTAFLEIPERNPIFVTPGRFGAPITEMGITAGLACAYDEPVSSEEFFPFLPSTRDGCDTLVNPGDLDGKLVLVDRGNCSFETKASNLQAAGASGVLFINIQDIGLSAGALDGSGIDIPVAGLSSSQGEALRSEVCPAAAAPNLLFAQWLNGEIEGVPNSVRLILQNRSGATDTGTITFQDASGDPVSPAQVGGIEAIPYEVAPFGTFDFSTPGTGPLQSGVIEVRSDRGPNSNLLGTEIFQVLGKPVSVPNSLPANVHRIYVSFSDEENTGMAFYNPHPELWTRAVMFLVDSGGEVVDQNAIELAPRQQAVGFVDNVLLFGETLADFPEGFQGSIVVVVEGGPEIAMLGLIQLADGSLIAVETSLN